MHWIDISIIAAFIIYAVSSGIRSSGVASQNLEEYFLAGRTLKGWQAGLSMAATQFAADTPLLVTGLIATAGIFALWRLWIYALAFLTMGFILAASWRRAGVLTDAELTELRYGARPAAVLRGAKAVYFGTIFNCTVLAMVLLAATRIAEPFLLWNEWLPAGVFQPLLNFVEFLHVPITTLSDDHPDVWIKSTNNLISIGGIVLVTLFYSTTGGLRSVVATDVMQLFLAMAATAVYAGYIIHKVGGMGELIETLRMRFADGGPGGITPNQILAFTPSQAKDAGLVVLVVFGLQWILQINADGTGYLAQRSMACRSEADARYAAVVFTVVQIFFRSLFWLPIALGLLVLFPPDLTLDLETIKKQQEATFVTGVAELLPPGLKGLMLTGMLAALASTVDTHLNWGSSYWTNDIYKRFICESWLKREPNPRTLVWVARSANVLILLIALVVMSQMSSIRTAWERSLLLGSGIGVLLVLRWLWWRINAWGEIACIVASILLTPILLLFVTDEKLGVSDLQATAYRLLLMAGLATAAGISVSLWKGPESEEHLRCFYRRARPMGFWGPIAAAEGDDPSEGARRLVRAAFAVVLAALSIFCLLVGAGSWLCGSPPPTWFPWRLPWLAGLLAVGILLIPVWVGLGFGRLPPDDREFAVQPAPESSS
ncbi:MAG: sodium transporter [Gemmatales bacterium]|nr:MAG: sodium transporter [Gemmatales bacterium]